MNKGMIIGIILKTNPHDYLALLTVSQALLCPLAFSSEPRGAGKRVHPHFLEGEARALGGKHFAPSHVDRETGRGCNGGHRLSGHQFSSSVKRGETPLAQDSVQCTQLFLRQFWGKLSSPPRQSNAEFRLSKARPWSERMWKRVACLGSHSCHRASSRPFTRPPARQEPPLTLEG